MGSFTHYEISYHNHVDLAMVELMGVTITTTKYLTPMGLGCFFFCNTDFNARFYLKQIKGGA